jgi:hypothetical protein
LTCLYFVKCSHFNFKVDREKVLFDEQNIGKVQNEGLKASEIIAKLSIQESLKKWKNPEVKQSYTNLCYWLDPVQSEILNDHNPYQIIVGAASTGKTLLIQLKAYQILQKDESAAVLIVLPLEIVKVKYIQFFEDCGLEIFKKLFVMTVEEDWETVMEEHNPHVLIDEFAAIRSMENDFLNKLLKVFHQNQQIKGNDIRLIWISIDFLQSYEILMLGLPQVREAIL